MKTFIVIALYSLVVCSGCSEQRSQAKPEPRAPSGAGEVAALKPEAPPPSRPAAAASSPQTAPPAAYLPAGARDALGASPADDAAAAAAAKSAAAKELLQRLAPVLSRSSEGLSWRDRGNGVRRLDLQGRFGHAMIAVRGEDGVVRSTCVEDLAGAERLLESADRSAP